MKTLNRRSLLSAAAAMGASPLWAMPHPAPSRTGWREQRELYPEGVASGDPTSDSVILWTRRPWPEGAGPNTLTVEVAEDEGFAQVVAARETPVSADLDWTCRVLVGGLKPGRIYWYRFTDADGAGSRVGRTITAPGEDDPRPVRFAFVSCQTVNEGKLNAYRRMIWEDKKAEPAHRLDFVLHLGDFIYEVVQYPDEVATRYGRRIYDIGRLPDARRVRDFHVPTTLEGYRFLYRAHLRDPDLQDARARFPFVPIWDNHEFSWRGWQSFVKFGEEAEPAQPVRVAANQAWFEYQPARVTQPRGLDFDRFDAPAVATAPIEEFDDEGLGVEANNLASIRSLTVYRALRYGRNVEITITDQHSYRMEEQTGRPEAAPLLAPEFPDFVPEEMMKIIDAGRAFDGGRPPDEIRVGDRSVPNFRKHGPPFSLFGRRQREWLKRQLTESSATWKIWGSSGGTLDWRVDPQNLPDGMTTPWPGEGFAGFGGGDFSGAYTERAYIYDAIRDAGTTGFVTVSGDRHSFWAGYAAKALPPQPFEPIGVAFITGSLSAPGLVEAVEYALPKDHPLRPLYLADVEGGAPAPAINLTMRHGVARALEYARSGDIEAARSVSNPDLSPHLAFLDMDGHGYSVVTATSDFIEVEFVCIPRPVDRSESPDGGPLRYRVIHRAPLWRRGDAPRLEQRIVEGGVDLSL